MTRALYRMAAAPVRAIDSPACVMGMCVAIFIFGIVLRVFTAECVNCRGL